MHYCRPDGNIPHDQTNQSPWWDAGAPQPCSNTPFHSLSATTHGHQSMAPLRTNASPLPYRFMADDFIITHPSLSFSSSRSAPSAEECDELSNNPFFHAPTADLATSADDSPRANPRSLTCACETVRVVVRADAVASRTRVEKQEGWGVLLCPRMISHHLSHIKGSAAGWYQMPSNC